MLISIVIPCFNESENILPLSCAIRQVMETERSEQSKSAPLNWEILWVNDGSTDKSLEQLRALSQLDPCNRFISFSRNFGHQNAIRAGLDHARGDAVITMDADFQHPPTLIPALFKLWREGAEIVNTLRFATQEETLWKKITSRGFYSVFKFLSNIDLKPGSADFRLFDRKVVQAICAHRENHLFLRGLITQIGFQVADLPYEAAARAHGVSKFSTIKMLRLARDGILGYSLKPLRMTVVLGLCFITLSLLYLAYAVYAYFYLRVTTPGWTSLIMCIMFSAGLQLFSLGVLAEYIGQIYTESKRRPPYLIRETNLSPDHERAPRT